MLMINRFIIFQSSKERLQNCLEWLEKCITETSTWMTHDLLKLNKEKMEFILFGT